MTEPQESPRDGLTAVPLEVVRYLRGEPLLLAGMGAAALIAVIAVAAPDGAAVYPWLISGIMFAACLLWAVNGALRRSRAATPTTASTRTDFKAGGRSETTDTDVGASGPGSSTRFEVAGKAKVKGVKVHSQSILAAVPIPEQRPPTDPPTGGSEPPAETPTMEHFVGRQAEVQEILALLPTPGASAPGTVVAVAGVRGIGKSALLERLAAATQPRTEVIVRRIDMALIVDGFVNDGGADASLAVLEHTFAVAAAIMGQLTDGDPRFEAVWQQHEASRQSINNVQVNVKSTFRMSGRSQAEDITQKAEVIVVEAPLTDEARRSTIRSAQNAVDRPFTDAWAANTAGRMALITVDSYERCADDEVGHWLLRLALRLPNTVTVVVHTPLGHPLPVESPRLQSRWLGPFSVPEVAEYLDRRLLHARLQPGTVELVHEVTEGHPGGVNLMGELVNQRGAADLTVDELRRLATRLSDDPAKKWAGMVDEILTTVPERAAVRAAAVVSSFTKPLLADLLRATTPAGGAPPAGGTTAAIRTLREYRLLRPVLTQVGVETDWLRMHEFIRQSVGQRLRVESPDVWHALHSCAADHYFGLLSEWDDETDACGYGSWFRYEHPDWQRYKREWLFHASHLGDRRAVTRTRFTLVFLEAFWWWGYYHPFDFNRHLVDDWDRASATWRSRGPTGTDQERDRDRRLGEALRLILTEYPVGYVKPSTARWGEIAGKLRLIRELCGLSRSPGRFSQRTEEERKVLALIEIFLAHSVRYSNPGDLHADAHYARARSGFIEVGDSWTVAWLDMECADLALERGRHDEIPPLITRSTRLERDDADSGGGWDHELLANLHRVRADRLWACGQMAEAATGYGLAVADAYWFQGIPHPPDEYTQRFYLEIVERAGRRIMELLDGGDRDGAVEFARSASQAASGTTGAPRITIERVRALVDSRELTVGGLFPAAPTLEDLRSDDSAFMDDWRRAREDALETADTLSPLAEHGA